ncbi:hypothetical protein PGTUg99_029056 [Puccinia graminis f. sp. tritici]|uniref:CxC1-like cysteine cluster associated with KDZ transposases domain-containing protein n=1 Tax=Puccinia graminis f. sp. tritici TaxID=56615 RepID=A0A5B0Q4L8_PUCGR|nr:hypothetical protein PGTUg99_029056 [Puccinia graminis f. sp. tritici]
MLPFTTALTEFLEPRSERLCVKGKNHARDLRKPFSAAVDLFRLLENKTDDLMESTLNLTEKDKLAARSCPSCFGPEPPNSSDYPESIRNRLVVCLDGNFQHRHHTKASRDYEALRTPNIFLPNDAVERMTREIRHMETINKPPSQSDRCADAHKAADDKRNESTWKGCDDTGLMGCCCRHDAAISMANIYKSGELRALPLALLKALLTLDPDRPVGVLYDIGCSLKKYIQNRGLLPELMKNTTFGTSIFHAYVHNWTCQLDYNPRLNNGWGLSDGEGLERMWSYLSPLVSPLRYASRNHRLTAIAHRLRHHNTKGIRQLPQWLSRKFKLATKRSRETQAELSQLLSSQNPFKSPGRNYTTKYFKAQWNHQQTFRADHTDEKQEQRDKLIKIYEHQITIDELRQECRESLLDPELDLLSEKEVKKIVKKIENVSKKLIKDAKEAEAMGLGLPSGEENCDEQRLLLLLWNSKNALYMQAVQLHAERQPLLDAKRLGTHLGTELKEKILKAIGNRRPAVQRLIDKCNKLFSEYLLKFPDQKSTNSALYPLNYDEFSSWPLDHQFWNDGLYFQSSAPWAIEPNVRLGINCVLILNRVQEEFQLLAQELARAVGWAIDYYDRIKKTVSELGKRIDLLRIQPEDVELDRFDDLVLYGLSRRNKLRLIRKELRHRQLRHTVLVEEWNPHVLWLAQHCQPSEHRKSMLRDWDNMKKDMELDKASGFVKQPEVDTQLEEAVLGEGADDGEDVDENVISGAHQEENIDDAAGGADIDDEIENGGDDIPVS